MLLAIFPTWLGDYIHYQGLPRVRMEETQVSFTSMPIGANDALPAVAGTFS